jgi:hypothetical protein
MREFRFVVGNDKGNRSCTAQAYIGDHVHPVILGYWSKGNVIVNGNPLQVEQEWNPSDFYGLSGKKYYAGRNFPSTEKIINKFNGI